MASRMQRTAELRLPCSIASMTGMRLEFAREGHAVTFTGNSPHPCIRPPGTFPRRTPWIFLLFLSTTSPRHPIRISRSLSSLCTLTSPSALVWMVGPSPRRTPQSVQEPTLLSPRAGAIVALQGQPVARGGSDSESTCAARICVWCGSRPIFPCVGVGVLRRDVTAMSHAFCYCRVCHQRRSQTILFSLKGFPKRK